MKSWSSASACMHTHSETQKIGQQKCHVLTLTQSQQTPFHSPRVWAHPPSRIQDSSTCRILADRARAPRLPGLWKKWLSPCFSQKASSVSQTLVGTERKAAQVLGQEACAYSGATEKPGSLNNASVRSCVCVSLCTVLPDVWAKFCNAQVHRWSPSSDSVHVWPWIGLDAGIGTDRLSQT